MNLAPICLFTYNRLTETKLTIEALKNNFLASESDLFVFSDGPKNIKNKKSIDEVRNFLKSVDGFKSIKIYESNLNKGLSHSVISGVTQILENYNKVIVLEDDLVTSPNFLNFMNQALNFYEFNAKIISISGYTLNLPSLINYEKDFYLGFRASSWGWGTWKDCWVDVDWDVKDYASFRFNLLKNLKFMRGGSDMPGMLRAQMNKKIDSWAIRWCYHQFKNDLLTIFPATSKLKSIGFGKTATHTKTAHRFNTILDQTNETNFKFSDELYLEDKLIKEFKNKFSIYNRLKSKIF